MPKYIAGNASVKVGNLSEYLNAGEQWTGLRTENEALINEGCRSFTECIILPKKHKVFDITVQSMAELKNVFPIKKNLLLQIWGERNF